MPLEPAESGAPEGMVTLYVMLVQSKELRENRGLKGRDLWDEVAEDISRIELRHNPHEIRLPTDGITCREVYYRFLSFPNQVWEMKKEIGVPKGPRMLSEEWNLISTELNRALYAQQREGKPLDSITGDECQGVFQRYEQHLGNLIQKIKTGLYADGYKGNIWREVARIIALCRKQRLAKGTQLGVLIPELPAQEIQHLYKKRESASHALGHREKLSRLRKWAHSVREDLMRQGKI